MAKDPAFLFYFRDFLVSTDLMTFEEKGQYITLLCHMADKGRLADEDILSVCDVRALSQRLRNKFKVDENGLFYNQRLEEETNKRKSYCESRRLARSFGNKRTSNVSKPYVERMGNANGNININKDVNRKDIDLIINDLNTVCGTSYKLKTPETRKMIAALIDDRGFTVDDFKTVHRKKFSEWGNDHEWSKFLRPSTLYQPKKFEGYLNQSDKNTPCNAKNLKVSQSWLEKREIEDAKK